MKAGRITLEQLLREEQEEKTREQERKDRRKFLIQFGLVAVIAACARKVYDTLRGPVPPEQKKQTGVRLIAGNRSRLRGS